MKGSTTTKSEEFTLKYCLSGMLGIFWLFCILCTLYGLICNDNVKLGKYVCHLKMIK